MINRKAEGTETAAVVCHCEGLRDLCVQPMLKVGKMEDVVICTQFPKTRVD